MPTSARGFPDTAIRNAKPVDKPGKIFGVFRIFTGRLLPPIHQTPGPSVISPPSTPVFRPGRPEWQRLQ